MPRKETSLVDIDLSDRDAWDDSALIRAYDRAISAYHVR